MKVAIVTCGLLDSMLPLVRRLAKKTAIDLYILVQGTHFSENVSSFDLSEHSPGLIDEATTEKILGDKLTTYARQEGAQLTIRLFKYPNLKIANRQNFRLHRTLANLLNRQSYDVVHFNGYRGSLFFVYAFLNRKTGKVWSIHDPVLHSGEEKWQTQLGYRSFRWLNAHFILHNRAQRAEFVAQSRIKADHCHFVRFGPLDIFRIFKEESPPKQSAPTALFYGRISPYKGVEYLIEATKIARQRLPELSVIIAGKSNYPIDLDRIKDDPSFEVIDRFITNEEVVNLIGRSGLVVCPYTDATQSGVIMTAYAFCKPVLATRVGGIPEVVEEGKTGRLVPPRDAPALADALVAMLSDEAKLADMQRGIEALSQSGPLSWDQIATQTLHVYYQSLTV